MSYYGPSFANIQSGWYRRTEDPNYKEGRDQIDRVWSDACNNILKSYVFKYGTFFTAFEEDIIHEIDMLLGTNLQQTARYYEYYLSSRSYEMPETRNRWCSSHEEEEQQKRIYTCVCCQDDLLLLDAHPKLIRKWGIPPSYCRRCDSMRYRYRGFDSIVLDRLPQLMRTLQDERVCEICSKNYSLEHETFTWEGFGGQFVDCLYPNLFANVCPKCFRRAFSDYKRGSPATQLNRLYELFLFLGRVPTQDFANLFYQCNNHDSIVELTHIMKKLRTPLGFKEGWGSFFAALVASGVLPSGTRRMVIGTMVLAEDGHLCWSLAEKEIDDFFFSHGIKHYKEVNYPNSRMRADWEIFVGKGRCFVEYFGLMDNEDYAKRAREKTTLAKIHDISLIAVYPDTNWKNLFVPLSKHGGE
jgi:hypothetical protein